MNHIVTSSTAPATVSADKRLIAALAALGDCYGHQRVAAVAAELHRHQHLSLTAARSTYLATLSSGEIVVRSGPVRVYTCLIEVTHRSGEPRATSWHASSTLANARIAERRRYDKNSRLRVIPVTELDFDSPEARIARDKELRR